MVERDRRYKTYNWIAYYDCPNPECRREWGVLMEFNNGLNFNVDDVYDEYCPDCGTKGERVSEHKAELRDAERRWEARHGY